MKRRIEFSILCGLGITSALFLSSILAVRLFPYRDLPIMPKPFFVYTLLPGIIAAEWLSHGWTIEGRLLFFLTNSIVYALAVFCIISIISAAKAQS